VLITSGKLSVYYN